MVTDEDRDDAAAHALVRALRRRATKPPVAYAGIGSRQTPPEIRHLMTDIATALAKLGWTLRTGGARGADEAFWTGTFSWSVPGYPGGPAEVYLPWPAFRDIASTLSHPTARATEIAEQHHPAWDALSDAAKKLLARNTHQILGADCRAPSKFVLCWTPDGATDKTTSRTGGTGQAIRVAVAAKIPVYNLGCPEHLDLWRRALEEIRKDPR